VYRIGLTLPDLAPAPRHLGVPALLAAAGTDSTFYPDSRAKVKSIGGWSRFLRHFVAPSFGRMTMRPYHTSTFQVGRMMMRPYGTFTFPV